MKKSYNLPKNYAVDEFDRDLAKEIVAISKAINMKFSFFNFALAFLSVSILCGVLLICILGVL